MGNNTPPQAPTRPDHEVGFFERRWRMLKAGVKGVFSYLLKPKTYIMAAAFGVGFAALAYAFPNVSMFSNIMPSITSNNFAAELLMYGAKMVSIGALIHMGTDAFKESRSCDHENQCVQNGGARHVAQQAPGQQKSQHPYDYQLSDDQYRPTDTPIAKTTHPNHQQPGSFLG